MVSPRELDELWEIEEQIVWLRHECQCHTGCEHSDGDFDSLCDKCSVMEELNRLRVIKGLPVKWPLSFDSQTGRIYWGQS